MMDDCAGSHLEAAPADGAARPRHVFCSEILDAVCREFGTAREDLARKGRGGPALRARQVAAFLICRHGRSQPAAGRAIGRDHTTVLSGNRRVVQLMRDDPAFAARVERIGAAIGSAPPRREASFIVVARKDTAPRQAPPPKPESPPQIDIAEIRRLRRRGWSLQGLCGRFGLPRHVVADIIGVTLHAPND